MHLPIAFLDSLESIGLAIGLIVVAVVLLGRMQLGRRGQGPRSDRGDAFMRGSGDDD